MPLPIAYSDFLNQNGALVNEGGPWTFSRSSGDVNCGTSTIAWCRDVASCLSCWVYPSASGNSFNVKFFVNVSVPMNQYGNANELSYDFSYRLEWASSKTTRGTPLSAKSSVGTNSFTDNFAADDYEELLHERQTWVGDPFYHSGTTPVTRYGDQMGYVYLEIGLTFPREVGAYINYYMKGASFRITTPTSIVEPPPSTGAAPGTPPPAAGGPSSSSTLSTSSTLISTLTTLSSISHLPSPNQSTLSSDSGGGASIASSSSPNGPSPSRKVSTAAIVGGAMGAVALLSLVVILILLYRRRKQRQEERRKMMQKDNINNNDGPEMDQQSFWATTPNSRLGALPSAGGYAVNTPFNNQHNVTPFMIPTQTPNPGGYAFDYGNGGGGSGGGPPSPQNSISRWIQQNNNAQSQYYNTTDAYSGSNVRRAPSVARSMARTAVTGTDAPPPAYIAPSALGVDVPPLPNQYLYDGPRPIPAAPSTIESDTFPASASNLGASSSALGLGTRGGTFVGADAGLSQWARENRSYITEKLEMKLDAAGYVPSDDPDNMTEEEWKREWGVTKLELTRMRALYARTQAQAQVQVPVPVILV